MHEAERNPLGMSGGEASDVCVLDIGCGDCVQSATFFASNGASVVALDVSEAACEQARTRAVGLPICVVCGDMQKLATMQLDPQNFDIVSAFYSLHHAKPEEHTAL